MNHQQRRKEKRGGILNNGHCAKGKRLKQSPAHVLIKSREVLTTEHPYSCRAERQNLDTKLSKHMISNPWKPCRVQKCSWNTDYDWTTLQCVVGASWSRYLNKHSNDLTQVWWLWPVILSLSRLRLEDHKVHCMPRAYSETVSKTKSGHAKKASVYPSIQFPHSTQHFTPSYTSYRPELPSKQKGTTQQPALHPLMCVGKGKKKEQEIDPHIELHPMCSVLFKYHKILGYTNISFWAWGLSQVLQC